MALNAGMMELSESDMGEICGGQQTQMQEAYGEGILNGAAMVGAGAGMAAIPLAPGGAALAPLALPLGALVAGFGMGYMIGSAIGKGISSIFNW